MGKPNFQSLQGMLMTMSKLVLMFVFVYGSILRRFNEASGIPFVITEKGLNFTTDVFAKRIAEDMDLGPFPLQTFHHDSRGIKAYIEMFKLYELVLPDGIHTGIPSKKGLKVGANNISFNVDCDWRNASLNGNGLEGGKFSAKVTGVNVSLIIVEIIDNRGKPTLDITSCEVSIDQLRFQTGNIAPFLFTKRHLTNELRDVICLKATGHVRDQLNKLVKQVFNNPIFTVFALSNFAYTSGYTRGFLKGNLWKDEDDEYPDIDAPSNVMVGGVLTEKFLNRALKAMYKRKMRDFSMDVNFMDDLTRKFGLNVPLENRPLMNIYVPNAPKARITSQGINITAVGRVIVVPCGSAIDSTKWLNSTLTFSLVPRLSMTKNRLILTSHYFRVTSGLFQSGPESDLVDAKVAAFLKMLQSCEAHIDLPLPEGISISKAWSKFNDGNVTLLVDLAKDEQ